MSEYLSFNKSGQWELHKADKPFKVFSGQAKDGNLHEDHGTKGSLHGALSGNKKKGINWENAGKPPHNMESVANERNPGVGD